MSLPAAVIHARLQRYEARRAARMMEIVHRLTKAAADVHRYVKGPAPLGDSRGPRADLEAQVAIIETRLGALAEELQCVLLDAVDAPASDTPVIAKIA